MAGIIIQIAEPEYGESFALLAYSATHQRWYPLWQLLPNGLTCFAFRHLLFSFLKCFNKKLVLKVND